MPTSSDIPPSSGFKRRRICLPYLPTEIIFKILLCLPAEILYNVMRFVCREWYNIIKDPKFIDAHLQESPTGLLIQFPYLNYSTVYLEMKENAVEITDLNLFPDGMGDGKGCNWFQPPSQSLQHKESGFSFHKSFKFPGRILASLNGLVLVFDLVISRSILVANLTLKKWVCLPPLLEGTPTWPNAGLGYAGSCKAYKVAYTHRYSSDEECYHCVILTLGVDKAWRCIATSDHLSCIPREDLKSRIFESETYSTGGYVHWIRNPYVLSLDVETERFHCSVVPDECRWNTSLYFLATESCLSFAVAWGKYIYELWALVDVETNHWKKLQRIDFGAQLPVIEQRTGLAVGLTPVALVKNGELFILRASISKGYFVICNVKSGAVDCFVNESWYASHYNRCSPFVKSLVSPKLEMKSM